MTQMQLLKIQIDTDLQILKEDLGSGLYEGRLEDFILEYHKIIRKVVEMISIVTNNLLKKYGQQKCGSDSNPK